ncbi:hypothetical protein UlMin_000182 [Ulmus minor]
MASPPKSTPTQWPRLLISLSSMATPRSLQSPQNKNNKEDQLVSHFRKTICLYDWWLIKTETDSNGKRLGVAGSNSKGLLKPLRIFASASIDKRLDVMTLETIDGLCILLKGLINQQKTIENGFPPEVFNAFVFGFPSDWEKFADKYCVEDATIEEESPKVSENGTIDTSGAADEKTYTSTHFRRHSNRLRKLQGKNPAFRCSLTTETENFSPISEITGLLDQGKLNRSLPRLSDDELHEPVDTHLAAKLDDKFVEDAPEQIPNFKEPHNSGNIKTPELYDAELHEPVDTNLAAKLDDKFVENAQEQTLNFKEPHNLGNIKTPVEKGDTAAKEESVSQKQAKRKIIYDTCVTPITRRGKAKMSIVSPESLGFRHSRSGRLLLPPLQFWRNQSPVYDKDRTVAGIRKGYPVPEASRGSRSKPQKKRKNRLGCWSGTWGRPLERVVTLNPRGGP